MERFPIKDFERPERSRRDAEKIASPEKMKKYLYTFGYTTPGRPKGSDAQDSRNIIIEADDLEKARRWGDHLADQYVQYLEKQTGERSGGFGGWIEAGEKIKSEIEKFIPAVRAGEEVNIGPLIDKGTKEFDEWQRKGSEGEEGFQEKRDEGFFSKN